MSPSPKRRTGWLRHPQTVWLRRAVFQVHLWLGIVLALYCVVIGLSGSALVFKHELDRVLEPQIYNIPAEKHAVDYATSVQRIVGARAGWVATAVRDFDGGDIAPTVILRPVGKPPAANYRMVTFNPYSGAVLADRMRFDGLIGWLTNLHLYLLAGGKDGLLLSGWMAVGLLVLLISGIVVWWPGVVRWKAALSLRRRSNWRRVNWDLHSFLGFWSFAALILITVTGIYFAFPDPVEHLVVRATGGDVQAEAAPPKPPPSTGPILSIDEAILATRKALPQQAPPTYLVLPTKTNATYGATGYYAGTAPFSQLVRIRIDAHTGKTLSLEDTRDGILGMRVTQYSYALHFGSFAGDGFLGIVFKMLWVLVGISPVVLAVSGLLMYWNRKLRPLWKRLRRRQVSSASV